MQRVGDILELPRCHASFECDHYNCHQNARRLWLWRQAASGEALVDDLVRLVGFLVLFVDTLNDAANEYELVWLATEKLALCKQKAFYGEQLTLAKRFNQTVERFCDRRQLDQKCVCFLPWTDTSEIEAARTRCNDQLQKLRQRRAALELVRATEFFAMHWSRDYFHIPVVSCRFLNQLPDHVLCSVAMKHCDTKEGSNAFRRSFLQGLSEETRRQYCLDVMVRLQPPNLVTDIASILSSPDAIVRQAILNLRAGCSVFFYVPFDKGLIRFSTDTRRYQPTSWTLALGQPPRIVNVESIDKNFLATLKQQNIIPPQHYCAACRRIYTHSLSRCARCGMTYYCGKDCQKAHWPTHRPQCKKQTT